MSEKMNGLSRKKWRELSVLRARHQKEKARASVTEALIGIDFIAPILLVGLNDETLPYAALIWIALFPLGCAHMYFYYKAGLTELDLSLLERELEKSSSTSHPRE